MRLLGESATSEREDRTNRLYQWLAERASFFRCAVSDRGIRRTVRTEETVRREAVTLLFGDPAVGFDTCPLCGNKLAPVPVEPARLRRPQGSISARRGGVEK
jgi:hypothetical protein